MKKLLVLLLISIMAIFVFAGCEGLVPPSEGEGEGEGEVEQGVVVEIDGMVALGGKNWVSCGNHNITVTFPAPTENVSAYISGCYGDYGKDKQPMYYYDGGDIVLFSNADKTVWTGSGYFGDDDDDCGYCDECPDNDCYDCCASYVNIISGECEPDTCISFPVVVDCAPPYALIEVTVEECVCDGCEIKFESTDKGQECADDKECCGDDCSGLAGWAIAIYDEDPFDKCCETPCVEPIYTCSGTACPIECTTDCLEETKADEPYYVVVNLVDNVGNEVEYYATISVIEGEDSNGDKKCSIEVTDYCADKLGCTCTSFDQCAEIDTDEYIGFCYPDCNCCNLIPIP